MKILVIEDEEAIARLLRRGLERAGYVVETAADGTLGLEMALTGTCALVILDLMLPGLDGWQVCQALREYRGRPPIPILMLSARGAVTDRVRGLDLGADDYMSKPFEFPELLARVRAQIRRDNVHRERILRVADLAIDTARRRVTRGGSEVTLSRREFDLLEALAGHQGQVLTREVIQQHVWEDDNPSNTVDVRIRQLRKKVDSGHRPRLIQTVRGVGYALRLPDEDAL